MRTPRLLFLISLVGLVVVGCGSRPPIDRTAVGQGTGFYCYRHQIPELPQYATDFCFRSESECKSSGAGSKNTSECTPAAHAHCFTFVEGGRKDMHCFGAQKNCDRDARAYLERATDVSRCEEL